MFRTAILAAAAGVFVASAAAPLAQTAPGRACAPHDVLVQRLETQFGETRQAYGLGANNALLEVYASASGSWSIIVTQPIGVSCLVASGENWEGVSAPKPAADRPA